MRLTGGEHQKIKGKEKFPSNFFGGLKKDSIFTEVKTSKKQVK